MSLCFAVSGFRMSATPPSGEDYNNAVRKASRLVSQGEVGQAQLLVKAAAVRAAGGNRPSAEAVGLAMKVLEKEKRKQKQVLPIPKGEYRLVVVSKEKKGKPSEVTANYFPIYGGISFFPEHEGSEEGVASNTAKVPVLGSIKFTGWYRWTPRVSKLEFNFYHMAIRLFGLPALTFDLKKDKSLSDQEYFNTKENKKKLPFFMFFSVEEEYAAARGRGGGLAMWRLESLTESPV